MAPPLPRLYKRAESLPSSCRVIAKLFAFCFIFVPLHQLHSVAILPSARCPLVFTFTDVLTGHLSYLLPRSASPILSRLLWTRNYRYVLLHSSSLHLHLICTSHSCTRDTPVFFHPLPKQLGSMGPSVAPGIERGRKHLKLPLIFLCSPISSDVCLMVSTMLD